MNETLVVVRGEEEAAVLAVLEMIEHRVRERDDEFEIAGAPPRCKQREHAVGEAGVVVEIAVEPRAAVLEGGVQPAVPPHRARG